MEWYIEGLAGLASLLLLVYMYFQWAYAYWTHKKIPSTKATFPFGDTGNPLTDKKGLNMLIKDIHDNFKSKGFKYGGFYAGTTPVFLLVNPSTIKTALTKDFQYFSSHGNAYDEKTDPLAANLFNMDGKEWKHMRVKLTPTFTSGKMKAMFQTLLTCGEQLEEHIDKLSHQGIPLDIKEISSCLTTDIIGSCAFGLDCNSFKSPNAEFRSYGRRVFQTTFRNTYRRFLSIASPTLVKALKISRFDSEITKFFIGVIDTISRQRETHKTSRNDFLQLLMSLKEEARQKGEDEFTLEQMAAQAFVFFLAGFETSSTTMTWCLYELVHNHDIQDKLRDEINRIIRKHEGLTYEAIMEMKYLDQVLNETLRKHPPVATLPRLCTQDYTLPDNEVLDKGTKVFISILGLHRDPEYFPNPDKFDPERFSDENKRNISPFTFLPFGEGPRICIGLRFGIMQAKVGLCLLLKNYRMHPHKSLKYPMEYDPKQSILTAKGTVMLTAEKL